MMRLNVERIARVIADIYDERDDGYEYNIEFVKIEDSENEKSREENVGK